MNGGARGSVGADGRVELTRVGGVSVLVYICMRPSLQEEADSEKQIEFSIFLAKSYFQFSFARHKKRQLFKTFYKYF